MSWLRPISPPFRDQLPWSSGRQSLRNLLRIRGLMQGRMLDPLILRLPLRKGSATPAPLALQVRRHLRHRPRLRGHTRLPPIQRIPRQRRLPRAVALEKALRRSQLLALPIIRSKFLHFV